MPPRKSEPVRAAFARQDDPIPPGVNVLFRPHPGPQTDALLLEEDEICAGGAKGGGKTALGIAWLMKGNPYHPPERELPWDVTYLNHRHYRALVLRKNVIDLGDWIDKAKRMYEPFGGVFRERPSPLFEFRTGAKIVLGHLDDADTYTKYQGQEYQRFLLEEATLVPDLKSYLMVRSCIRSTDPELHCQTLLTCNPGGPGHSWVRDRFIKPKDKDGRLIPPNTRIVDPLTGETRIFLPMKLKDNPALANDPTYVKKLMGLPEAERRAFLDGDWDALSGVFFCCDDQTEFLTSSGFRPIDQINIGDLVASLSPQGEMVYVPCSRVVHERYEGELIVCETPQMNFAVTPNHNMYCEKDNGNTPSGVFSFVRADELPRASLHPVAISTFVGLPLDDTVRVECESGRETESQECICPVCGKQYQAKAHRLRHRRRTTCSRDCSYALRATYYGRKEDAPVAVEEEAKPARIGHTFDTADWMELLGWFLSEGCTSGGTYFSISQEKHPERVKRIADLLCRMGLHYRFTGTEFRVYSKALVEYFRQFGLQHQRYIPREYMNAPAAHLWRLFDGLFLGDGCPNPNGAWQYYTVSKQLADDVQELCIKLGRRASISLRKQQMGRPFGYSLGVSHPGKRATRVWSRKLRRVAYSGYVGCVTAEPYHTILIRRNGRILWTGNTEFRPMGPLTGEPDEACHVIPAKPLKPWLNRLIGMDWGFAHEGAAYWGCDNDDGRFHVYRELVRSRLGAEAWGVEIALASMEDLKGQEQNTMTLYLSPDAWEKRSDTRTIADQIAAGIRRVLGPNSVLLTEEETGDPDEVERMRHQQRYGIMVRRAPNQRIAGAQYIRSQLRWWPLTKVAKESFSNDLFLRLLRADPSRAMEYKDAFETRQKQEVLPGLLIHDSCPRIIEVLQNVVHSLSNPEDVEKRDGDDPYDGFRYLVFAHSKEKRREPFEEHFARRLEQVAAMHGGVLDGNTRVQVARKAEEDYNQAFEAISNPVYFPRLASRRAKEGWRN